MKADYFPLLFHLVFQHTANPSNKKINTSSFKPVQFVQLKKLIDRKRRNAAIRKRGKKMRGGARIKEE